MPLATGNPAKTDDDGTPIYKPDNQILLYIALTLKWITYIFLYGGVIAVITGVYTMTPETANGRGAIPLAGDGKIPGVDAQVPGYSGHIPKKNGQPTLQDPRPDQKKSVKGCFNANLPGYTGHWPTYGMTAKTEGVRVSMETTTGSSQALAAALARGGDEWRGTIHG